MESDAEARVMLLLKWASLLAVVSIILLAIDMSIKNQILKAVKDAPGKEARDPQPARGARSDGGDDLVPDPAAQEEVRGPDMR